MTTDIRAPLAAPIADERAVWAALLARSSAMRPIARSTAPGAASYSRTTWPAARATWAIPPPIVPAPTIPTTVPSPRTDSLALLSPTLRRS